MEIGKRIAELRKERKWTQLELAEKLFVTDKWKIMKYTTVMFAICFVFFCPLSVSFRLLN